MDFVFSELDPLLQAAHVRLTSHPVVALCMGPQLWHARACKRRSTCSMVVEQGRGGPMRSTVGRASTARARPCGKREGRDRNTGGERRDEGCGHGAGEDDRKPLTDSARTERVRGNA